MVLLCCACKKTDADLITDQLPLSQCSPGTVVDIYLQVDTAASGCTILQSLTLSDSKAFLVVWPPEPQILQYSIDTL